MKRKITGGLIRYGKTALILGWLSVPSSHAQLVNSGTRVICFHDPEETARMTVGTGMSCTDEGLTFHAGTDHTDLASDIIAVPLDEQGDFIAFGTEIRHSEFSGSFVVRIRSSEDGNTWSDWFTMQAMDLVAKGKDRFRSELHFLNRNTRYVQLKIAVSKPAGEIVSLLDISLFFTSPLPEPGKTRILTGPDPTVAGEEVFARPPYVNRSGWGCPQPENTTERELTTVTHLILHHSAGNTSAADFAAVVLAYWDYHVNGNGWDDIGYNWLVDRNGTIYKGRAWYNDTTENVKGAHNSGKNSGTAGICMIGNFTEDTIPSGALWHATSDLLAYLCGHYELDPQGVTYHAAIERDNDVITGHRDSGGGTVCPGDIANSYAAIRQTVTDKLEGIYTPGPSELRALTDDCPGSDVTFSWENAGTGWQLQVAGDPLFDPYFVKWVSDLTTYTGPAGFVLAPGEEEPLDHFLEGERYFWRIAYNSRVSITASFTMPSCHSEGIRPPDRREVEVKVFPNPSKSSFLIRVPDDRPGGFRIRLFSPSGQMIYETETTLHELSIQSDSFTGGVYLLMVETDDARTLMRVVLTD